MRHLLTDCKQVLSNCGTRFERNLSNDTKEGALGVFLRGAAKTDFL
jgi:hypothetical protein